jgi:hypothetical protein
MIESLYLKGFLLGYGFSFGYVLFLLFVYYSFCKLKQYYKRWKTVWPYETNN